MQHDRQEEAREVVSALLDKPLDDPDVTSILLEIHSVIQEEHKGGPFHFRELFEWGKIQTFRRLLLTISVQLGQQFSWSNMISSTKVQFNSRFTDFLRTSTTISR